MASKKTNFFSDHWDWFAAAAGLAVLAVFLGMFFSGTDGEQTAEEYGSSLESRSPSGKGVAKADLSKPENAFALVETPPAIAQLDPKAGSFLGSGKYVLCQNKDCRKPIPFSLKTCVWCQAEQVEVVKDDPDTDKDGMPNEWELKYGLNPADPADADLDKDKDGFTNREEHDAKTDPSDPDSHPDYMAYFRVDGPLKQTKLPFYLLRYNELPGKRYRVYFAFPGRKDAYGQPLNVNGVEGEEILISTVNKSGKTVTSKSGYKIGKINVQQVRRETLQKNGSKLMKDETVVTVQVIRISDGKTLEISLDQRNVAVDNQGVLAFDRGEFGPFTVVPGDKVKVFNREYEVVSLGGSASQPEIVIKDLKSGETHTVR